MAIKAATSNFNNTFTGYLVKTDDGFVSAHNPDTRAVDINHSGQIFLTSEEASQAYADAHYVQSRCGADGREWPQNIRIMETDVHLVALSATCMNIAGMVNKLYEQNDPQDTLTSRFFTEAAALDLQGWPYLASPVHFFPSGLLKKELSEHEQERLNLFNADKAQEMLNHMQDSSFPRDRNIMTHHVYSGATSLAHDFIMTSGLVDRGFMARNPRVMMGVLIASHDAAKPATMPIAEENTAPHVRMMREMKKLAL